jgi:hypothetical protein
MPSTFTPSLKIELIGNGEQPTTWGSTTNNNMGTLIEQSIAGVQPITLTGNTVLSNFNGISDQARNAVLVFNGALSNTANVVAPSVEKTYIVSNRAGANVVIKTATGVGVSVSNNTNVLIYCDGADFYTAVNPNNVIGNLSVSGNQTVAGSISIGGDITINNKITSNAGTLNLNSGTGVVDMFTNSGALTPPTGTDAERPSTPDLGMTRWNSTQGILEIWNGVQWQNITGNYAIDYFVVSGGGGGGPNHGGGGGAGGFLANSTTISVGTAYTITVGAGGSTSGTSGSNSTAFGLTPIGGGAGGSGDFGDGSNGGSGGGGSGPNNDPAEGNPGGSGTAGQGFAGGYAKVNGDGGNLCDAAGGGGAGAVGASTNPFQPGGAGGIGVQSSITGTATYYAGGGGGGSWGAGGGSGGQGGGGAGSASINGGQSGSANSGGGGGGSGNLSSFGGSGGAGVVIIRYASASQRGTGGVVTSYSDAGITYFVHTFNSSGTFTA